MIRNIGMVLSGDLARPVLSADCIVIDDGLISAVGHESALETGGADRVIDAGGSPVCPGLIDSHCHPVFGDWTPRQNQLGWIEMG
ncbi:MAG: Enamidase, partial [Gemmobacter sp.]|nr:Enamidase [Gemmobacter sp.]